MPGRPASQSGKFSPPGATAGGSGAAAEVDCRPFNQSGISSTPAGPDGIAAAGAACSTEGGDCRPFNQSGVSSTPTGPGCVAAAGAACSTEGGDCRDFSQSDESSTPTGPGGVAAAGAAFSPAGGDSRDLSQSGVSSTPAGCDGSTAGAACPPDCGDCRDFSHSEESSTPAGWDGSYPGCSVKGVGCSGVAGCGSPPSRASQSALFSPGDNCSSEAGVGVDSTDLPPRRPASQSGTSSSSEAAWLRPESQSGRPSEESGAGAAGGTAGSLSCAVGAAMVSPSAGRFPSRKVRNQDGSARSNSAVFFLVGASPGRMGAPRLRLTFSNSEVFRLTGSSPGLMTWESSDGEAMTGLRRAPQNWHSSSSSGLGFPHIGQRTSAIPAPIRTVRAEEYAQSGGKCAESHPEQDATGAGCGRDLGYP